MTGGGAPNTEGPEGRFTRQAQNLSGCARFRLPVWQRQGFLPDTGFRPFAAFWRILQLLGSSFFLHVRFQRCLAFALPGCFTSCSLPRLSPSIVFPFHCLSFLPPRILP